MLATCTLWWISPHGCCKSDTGTSLLAIMWSIKVYIYSRALRNTGWLVEEWDLGSKGNETPYTSITKINVGNNKTSPSHVSLQLKMVVESWHLLSHWEISVTFESRPWTLWWINWMPSHGSQCPITFITSASNCCGISHSFCRTESNGKTPLSGSSFQHN